MIWSFWVGHYSEKGGLRIDHHQHRVIVPVDDIAHGFNVWIWLLEEWNSLILGLLWPHRLRKGGFWPGLGQGLFLFLDFGFLGLGFFGFILLFELFLSFLFLLLFDSFFPLWFLFEDPLFCPPCGHNKSRGRLADFEFLGRWSHAPIFWFDHLDESESCLDEEAFTL